MMYLSIKKFNSFTRKHRWEIFFFSLLLVAATFLRFYDLAGYMTFLGDEGRDALMAKRILTTFDLPLIGPPMSLGNIYLGPLYYYMMAVVMGIFWLNPVAAAGMVALIGVLTVALLFFLTREWFGRSAAFIVAFLYAISPVTITYSRSSWNPNPVPFFALLFIASLYLAKKYNIYRYYLLTGISAGAIIQMHYIALLIIPAGGIIWLNELYTLKKNKLSKKSFILNSFGAVGLFLFMISPLIVFDIKHNFVNYNAFTSVFFGSEGNTVKYDLFYSLSRLWGIFDYSLITRYITGGNQLVSYIVVIGTVVPLLNAFVAYKKTKKLDYRYFILLTWLVVGLLGLSLIKREIYDHYIAFLNPVPYLLLGACISLIISKKSKIVAGVGMAIFVILVLLNMQQNPLRYPPNNQLQKTQDVASFIIEKAQGKPLNFALIAERNYDAGYQYFLELYGHKPKMVPTEITDQLFVVCEDAVCNPVGHAKYEIAAFGMAKIEESYEYQGLQIFKLVANPLR